MHKDLQKKIVYNNGKVIESVESWLVLFKYPYY